MTYNSSNLATSIVQGNFDLNIKYGPDNTRLRSILLNDDDTIKTKYFSINYEKVITNSNTKELSYIYSPYGLVAVSIKQNNADSLYYVETDHLGSLIGLIRENGSYAGRFSYDVWGRRRNPDTWSYDSIPSSELIDRGFTGHEHLEEFGLINMNGRMYDPLISRFLSVDPIISDPGNTQSYNGYGYCLNNPLQYSDPSGMLACPMDFHPDMNHNPEGAAWLANYQNGASGSGGDSPWVNNFLNYSHACFENGGEASIAEFDYEVNTAPTGSTNITIQTGTEDTFMWLHYKDEKEWHQGEYLYSKPIYSTITISSGRGPGWEAYVGTAGSVVGEVYYSKTFGTWMGKNFKFYNQSWGGNLITGGKYRFAGKTSDLIKNGGRLLGIWNGYSIYKQYQSGEMSTGWMLAEQVTNAVSSYGIIYGAAWGLGWELGRAITSTNWYKEFKFNYWYDRLEKQIGPPSQSNELLWYYFFKSYEK